MERNIKKIKYVEVKTEYKHLRALISKWQKGKVLAIKLVGPQGTAKTTLAITLAKEFNSHYEIVDGSDELERRDLEGVLNITKGETIFTPGPIVKAIQIANEKGICFLIMNEVNAILESVQVGFNSLLSEGHVNLNSNAGERYCLNEDAKLIVIATMNLKVCGINELQEAFDDRYYLNKIMEYADAKTESRIIVEITGCKKEMADLIVEVAQQFRQAAMNPNEMTISKIFSTRLSVNFANVVSLMGVEFLNENITDMIVNKLCKEPGEVETGIKILQGKDFKNRLYNILADVKEVEEPTMEINDESMESIVNEIMEKEKSDVAPVKVDPKPKVVLTKFLLNSWTRKEIKDYCRANGISGYSKKVKDEIIALVLNHEKKVVELKKEFRRNWKSILIF